MLSGVRVRFSALHQSAAGALIPRGRAAPTGPGGRAVLDTMEKAMQLSKEVMEPSRAGLYRFGNVSSTSVWYVLAFCESFRGVKRGDKVGPAERLRGCVRAWGTRTPAGGQGEKRRGGGRRTAHQCGVWGGIAGPSLWRRGVAAWCVHRQQLGLARMARTHTSVNGAHGSSSRHQPQQPASADAKHPSLPPDSAGVAARVWQRLQVQQRGVDRAPHPQDRAPRMGRL